MALVRLAILGLGSLAIYYLAFLRPYPLQELWYRPKHNLGSVALGAEWAHATYWLGISALFLLYFLALRITFRLSGTGAWRLVIGGIAAFNILALLLHPLTSNDVFDYIIRGRMLSLYGGNPFYQVPHDFVQDPFYPYAWWRDIPSAYGPVWESMAAGITKLAGDGVVANVIGFKFVAILGYLGTILVVGLMLRSLSPDRVLYGVTFLGWNPLVILETAGNAHNDMLMVFSMVLGLYWLHRGRPTLAVLTLAAGTLIKFMPALLVPVVLVEAAKRLESWRARVRFLAVAGFAGSVLVAAAYAPFWQGGDILGVGRRSEMFSTSIATLAVGLLEGVVDYKVAARVVSGLALLLLLAWVAVQLRRLWRDRSALAPVRASLSILLFYLLVLAPWFFQWYLEWPLAIAALLPPGAFAWGTMLFALTASWKPPVFFLFFRVVHEHPALEFIWPEWPVTLVMISPPLVFFAYTLFTRSRRRTERSGVVPTPAAGDPLPLPKGGPARLGAAPAVGRAPVER